MRKNFGKKNWIVPQPVLIITTYDENGSANAMNAAWGGMYDEYKVMICLSTEHKTTQNILKSNEFVINFPSSKYAAEADYFGIETGNKVSDKIERAGLTIEKSEFVNAPVIKEFPIALDCKCLSIQEVDEGTTIVIASIVNASIDEAILDENKKNIDDSKLDIISYDPIFHTYKRIGESVAKAFQSGVKFKK